MEENVQLEPRQIVTAATDHLAGRLRAIVADRLSGVLGGRPWTDVLKVLDQRKGRAGTAYRYTEEDLQLQLRMLTERLGALGYPFDDQDRSVSTLGSELRTVRRRLAHTAPFDWLETWRATDYCVRLLEAFEDATGLERALELRHEAFEHLAAGSGAKGMQESPNENAARRPLSYTPPSGEPDEDRERATGADPEVTFEQWPGAAVGDSSVLDNLRRNDAKEQVRSHAEEIVDIEWPVSLRRLGRLVAAGFGMERPGKDRLRRIGHQVRASRDVQVDADDFVWPGDVDIENWRGYRKPPGEGRVDLSQVSPREIANLMTCVREDDPGIDADALEDEMLRRYGRVRRTDPVVRKLDKAWEYLG